MGVGEQRGGAAGFENWGVFFLRGYTEGCVCMCVWESVSVEARGRVCDVGVVCF